MAKLMLTLAKLDSESFKVLLQAMSDEQKGQVETLLRRAVQAAEQAQDSFNVSRTQIQLKSFI